MKVIRFALSAIVWFLLIGPLIQLAVAQNNEEPRDEQSSVVDFEEMRYPLAARLKHTEGVVVLRVKLNKDGQVLSAETVSGPRDLVADCISNVKTWRFVPNSRGEAIAVYWFHIEGLCHGYGSSQFAFFPSNFARITSCEAHIEP